MNSLSDDEIEETEMVINPPNPNFVSYEREIPDTIGTMEILVNDSD